MSDWLRLRVPFMYDLLDHLKHYQAPKNLNFWYFFGALSLLVLGNQLLTGIWLLMYYTPTAADAMASIEFMMREVNFGWLFSLLACCRCVIFLCGCVFAYVSSATIWLI